MSNNDRLCQCLFGAVTGVIFIMNTEAAKLPLGISVSVAETVKWSRLHLLNKKDLLSTNLTTKKGYCTQRLAV